jgi:hypothetical protein
VSEDATIVLQMGRSHLDVVIGNIKSNVFHTFPKKQLSAALFSCSLSSVLAGANQSKAP